MDAEGLAVNQGAQGQKIKHFRAVPPHVGVAIFPQTLVVKTVHLRDLAAFMVAADEGDAVGPADFEGEQEQESLDRVESPVYKVAHEEILDVREGTARVEELEQVVKLAVDIAGDCDGGGNRLDIGLVDEEFAGAVAELLDLGLVEILTALELLDPAV